MYSIEKIKKEIIEKINKTLGTSIGSARAKKIVQASDQPSPELRPASLVYPPDAKMGDLSLPCFDIAKKVKKSPVELANWLVGEIRVEGVINSLKAIGPYLNIDINKESLAREVLSEINKKKLEYGKNKTGKNKKVMIEYSNANTHKEYHVGHLRNVCYGDAVNRILAANGYKNIPVSYINDFGIHVAKTLWAFLEFYKNKKLPKNKGYFLGQVYVRSTKEIEKDPLAKEKVSFLMKKIETRKGEEYNLWKKTRQWSIDQFDKIYKDLDIKFDYIYYESEFVEKGMKMVEDLYKKRLLIKSEGAIIANLEKYDLGVLIFLRSDGTAMYPVADLPLALEKIKNHKLDQSIYVVDNRQSLYFKQIIKILELMGNKKSILHLGYDIVKLPSGMMSSRTGNVITYEDLREQVFNVAQIETKNRHQDWSDQKIKKTALALTIGAIKFEMIKIGAEQIISFDINQALRFDGYTAGYIQYTYARINSIIKKAESRRQKLEVKHDLLTEYREHDLILMLAKYPEIIIKTSEKYDPSELSKYLYELAQIFNDYYHKVPVLKAEEDIKLARLALLSSVNQVIANGLDLLGIEAIKEM